MRNTNPTEPGSSPHTRGARAHETRRGFSGGIIPAYAGSTPSGSQPPDPPRDHPRIRGEHAQRLATAGSTPGSSPHTRGARPSRPPTSRSVRIIPAYAGSTGSAPTTSPGRPDHPRIRGEHVFSMRIEVRLRGSSPHTRGAPPWRGSGPFGIRIIPAYAGSTNTWRTTPPSTPDHPRIRGEHALEGFFATSATGSSPHTRGARKFLALASHACRIIPAYAGSTCRWSARSSRVPDHPRIRGEHSVCAERAAFPRGSSPHTRGAQSFQY